MLCLLATTPSAWRVPASLRQSQSVVVNSGTEPVVHFQLNLAGAKETINVSGAPVDCANRFRHAYHAG